MLRFLEDVTREYNKAKAEWQSNSRKRRRLTKRRPVEYDRKQHEDTPQQRPDQRPNGIRVVADNAGAGEEGVRILCHQLTAGYSITIIHPAVSDKSEMVSSVKTADSPTPVVEAEKDVSDERRQSNIEENGIQSSSIDPSIAARASLPQTVGDAARSQLESDDDETAIGVATTTSETSVSKQTQ